MWACDQALTSQILSSYNGAGPMFVQAVQTFLAAQCALLGDHVWPDDAIDKVLKDPNYDFIVVGAGSAGSVVANRLSEVPDWKVLLVEAGGNPNLATETPTFFFNNVNSSIDWGYRPHPQDRACRGYTTKSCAWPRGKVLGGCSSVNGMYYVRANKHDYDEWADAGNPGWNYQDILPYFTKSEIFSEPLSKEFQKYHGNKGYLSVEARNDAHDLEKLLIKAVSEIGMKHVYDVNGADQMGITKCPTTTKDGVRHSTARAFLSPIKDRPNLHVLKNAHVTKILFKPGTNVISGITAEKDGKALIINAKKEIIVSAGAINSPQLLMLSGIGPKKHLEDLHIEVKADLPVGQNLQDHIYVPMYFTMPSDLNSGSLPDYMGAFVQYILERKGPLSTTIPNRVISYMNTKDPTASIPDIQFHYLFFPPNITEFIDLYKNHGFSEEVQRKFRELNKEHLVVWVAAVLLRPTSKGEITLQSTNPHQHPLIYANYFDKKEDLETIMAGIKQHIFKLDNTETFKATGIKFSWLDLEACQKYDKSTDEFLKCYSEEMTTSLYHPTSTVKMGPNGDESAVVDHELRVKKVKGLRVIDASIMPNIVRGNTNAPTIMIGEKGADLIKSSWINDHNEL